MDYTIGESARLHTSNATPGRGEQFGRLLVLDISDIDTAPPRDYLLKGLMSPNELSVWVGPPKCGKSFLMLHVAYLLSLGRSVFNCRVKPTRVLYIAAEGEGGINKRLQALRNTYGPSENFHFIAQQIDLLRDIGHKKEVEAAAIAIGAQLIVVDTLNRALAGGDENSPQDMGTLIRNVSDIRQYSMAHIAIIHHGTKASNGSSPRGHGSLEGADDALIQVMKLPDGSRVATVVHAKDDADGQQWTFNLDRVELGTDEDGDPITTLIVREIKEATDAAVNTLTPNEQVALTCLDKALKAEAILATVGPHFEEQHAVRETAWRARYYAEAKSGRNQDAKQKGFKRALDGLQAKQRVASENGFYWRPNAWR